MSDRRRPDASGSAAVRAAQRAQLARTDWLQAVRLLAGRDEAREEEPDAEEDDDASS